MSFSRRFHLPFILFTVGLALSALAATAQSHADQKAIVADCAKGECRCLLSDLTMNDVAITTGTDLPADPESVMVFADGEQMGWTSLTRTETEIVLGGDGRCDLELFEDWTPEDGLWNGRTALTAVSGAAECSQLGALAVQMMNSDPTLAQVAWGDAFDMQKFWEGTAPGPEEDRPVWTQVDKHTATGKGGGGGIATSYRAKLLSPVRLVLDTRISGEGCTFDLRTQAFRQG